MSLPKVHFCVVCRKTETKIAKDSDEILELLKSCTRCRIVKYCSRSCQRMDFKKHKDVCALIQNESDEVAKLWLKEGSSTMTQYAYCQYYQTLLF
jgi:uncharacterized protein YqgV (UPF0045/DUF77 family)